MENNQLEHVLTKVRVKEEEKENIDEHMLAVKQEFELTNSRCNGGSTTAKRRKYIEAPPGKPHYSYTALITMAITSSPERKMTSAEIHKFITANFPYYRNCSSQLRNNISCNLSSNGCFVKLERDSHNAKRCHYWTVDPTNEITFTNGNTQCRKRTILNQEDLKEILPLQAKRANTSTSNHGIQVHQTIPNYPRGPSVPTSETMAIPNYPRVPSVPSIEIMLVDRNSQCQKRRISRQKDQEVICPFHAERTNIPRHDILPQIVQTIPNCPRVPASEMIAIPNCPRVPASEMTIPNYSGVPESEMMAIPNCPRVPASEIMTIPNYPGVPTRKMMAIPNYPRVPASEMMTSIPNYPRVPASKMMAIPNCPRVSTSRMTTISLNYPTAPTSEMMTTPNYPRVPASEMMTIPNYSRVPASKMMAIPNCPRVSTSEMMTIPPNYPTAPTSEMMAIPNYPRVPTSEMMAIPNCSRVPTSRMMAISPNCPRIPTIPNHSRVPTNKMMTIPNYPGDSTSEMMAIPNYPRVPTSEIMIIPNYPGVPESEMMAIPNYPGVPASEMMATPNCPRIPASEMMAIPNCPRVPASDMITIPNYPRVPASEMMFVDENSQRQNKRLSRQRDVDVIRPLHTPPQILQTIPDYPGVPANKMMFVDKNFQRQNRRLSRKGDVDVIRPLHVKRTDIPPQIVQAIPRYPRVPVIIDGSTINQQQGSTFADEVSSLQSGLSDNAVPATVFLSSPISPKINRFNRKIVPYHPCTFWSTHSTTEVPTSFTSLENERYEDVE